MWPMTVQPLIVKLTVIMLHRWVSWVTSMSGCDPIQTSLAAGFSLVPDGKPLSYKDASLIATWWGTRCAGYTVRTNWNMRSRPCPGLSKPRMQITILLPNMFFGTSKVPLV